MLAPRRVWGRLVDLGAAHGVTTANQPTSTTCSCAPRWRRPTPLAGRRRNIDILCSLVPASRASPRCAGPAADASRRWPRRMRSLAAYEWTHLLIHTAYRPRRRWFRGLRAHHRLHHFRNEHNWFGVTTKFADRIFATLPAPNAVPLSPTARTLGIDNPT